MASYNPKNYPYVSSFTDRHGKLRWRYRKDGITVALGTDYGGPEFTTKLNAAIAGEADICRRYRRKPALRAAQGRATYTKPEPLSRLLLAWLHKPEHHSFTQYTRQNQIRCVDVLRQHFREIDARDVTVRAVQGFMHENTDRAGAANRCLGILRAVLDGAVAVGVIEANPAHSVGRLPVNAGTYRTWTEQDVIDFYAVHAPGSLAHLAMTLMLYTGTSRAEAVKLGPANVSAGRLRYTRHLPGSQHLRLIDIPVYPALAACLASLPPNRVTFLETDTGEQRSPTGLGNAMRAWCDAAGLSGCSASGLRKACRRRLAAAGMREQEIAAVLGYEGVNTAHGVVGMGHRPSLADIAIAAISPEAPPEPLRAA